MSTVVYSIFKLLFWLVFDKKVNLYSGKSSRKNFLCQKKVHRKYLKTILSLEWPLVSLFRKFDSIYRDKEIRQLNFSWLIFSLCQKFITWFSLVYFELMPITVLFTYSWKSNYFTCLIFGFLTKCNLGLNCLCLLRVVFEISTKFNLNRGN